MTRGRFSTEHISLKQRIIEGLGLAAAGFVLGVCGVLSAAGGLW